LKDWARFSGMNAVLQQWVKNDPESAIAWAVQTGAPEAGDGKKKLNEEGNWAVATLIGSLAKTDLDRAVQVAAEQPVSKSRARMMDTLISEYVAQRGEEAARDELLNLPDVAFRTGMAARLSERYAEADPRAAAAWATSLPAGETQQRAVAEVVAQWANKDPVAAGTYLQQLGASPAYDDARQRFAFEIVRKDPESAISWAMAISDENRRIDSVQGVLRDWVRRDPPTAQAWATANNVPLASNKKGAK